jgi:hypothetical protein
MDILLYHEELAGGELPDCCVRCGERDTVFVPTVISTQIPILGGGSFQYQTLELPFCAAHEKPPLVSLSYPGAKAFTAEGVVVTNVCEEFVHAVKRRRKRHPVERAQTLELVEPPPPNLGPGAMVWVLFGLGLLVATLALGGGIAFFVLRTVPK